MLKAHKKEQHHRHPHCQWSWFRKQNAFWACALFDYARESRLLLELTQQRQQFFNGESVALIENTLQQALQKAQHAHQQLSEQLQTVKEQSIATRQQNHYIQQLQELATSGCRRKT